MTLDELITYRNQLHNTIRQMRTELKDLEESLQTVDDSIDDIYEGKQGELPL